MDYGDDYWGLYRDRDYYRDPFPHSPEPLNLKLYIDSLKGSLKKTLNPQRDPIPKHQTVWDYSRDPSPFPTKHQGVILIDPFKRHP